MKKNPLILKEVYQEWYKQRMSNEWEDFNVWLDENITPE